MSVAPIALFAYNRLWHVSQTIEALKKNALSNSSELIIFSDGSKDEASDQKVEEVRQYLKTISGFKSVNIIERKCNLGLAQSIISGVTEVVNEYERVIVMEDDLVTSPFFLRYMNDALEYYANEDKVISIHGYCYPVGGLPDTFFLRGADCWGWATWKRGWDLFETDGALLLQELKAQKLTYQFDFDGAYPHTKMLMDQIRGKNNSWAIRWHASAFLKDKLTLYPGRSLVLNIGHDNTGVHCSTSTVFTSDLSDVPVKVDLIAVEDNIHARSQIVQFLRTTHSLLKIPKRLIDKLLEITRWPVNKVSSGS